MTPTTPLTPVLSRFWDDEQPWTLQTYLQNGGYQGLQRALAMPADDVIAMTRSPIARPSLTVWMPTPPLAAVTTTVSPMRRRARPSA